jgi:hypothetical protein
MVGILFAGIPAILATSVFIGSSSASLAYGLLRDAHWLRLPASVRTKRSALVRSSPATVPCGDAAARLLLGVEGTPQLASPGIVGPDLILRDAELAHPPPDVGFGHVPPFPGDPLSIRRRVGGDGGQPALRGRRADHAGGDRAAACPTAKDATASRLAPAFGIPHRPAPHPLMQPWHRAQSPEIGPAMTAGAGSAITRRGDRHAATPEAAGLREMDVG